MSGPGDVGHCDQKITRPGPQTGSDVQGSTTFLQVFVTVHDTDGLKYGNMLYCGLH